MTARATSDAPPVALTHLFRHSLRDERVHPLLHDIGRLALANAFASAHAEVEQWRRDKVWVEVEDNSSGIAPDHLARVLDSFFTTKPVGCSTGLGLSLAYGIVQKHHGRIDMRSEPGRGSCVRVTLPVRRPGAEGVAT